MKVEFQPMSDAGGAEVVGIDVADLLSKEVIDQLEMAFLEFGVLLFRNQKMQALQLVAFSNQFGDLQPHVQKNYRHPEAPEVVVMTNRKPDGSFDEAGARRGAVENLRDGWHSDLSYDPNPAKATILHSLEVTSRGGNTYFSNVTKAYEAMPEKLKKMAIGKWVEFPYGGVSMRNKSAAKAAEALDLKTQEFAAAIHPAINIHPVTRKPAIYANPLLAHRIQGIPQRESEELLESLFDWIDRKEFQWAHNWSAGDTIMWENRGGIMHSGRLDYPLNETRRFIRTTIRGGPTEAYILE